MGVWVLDGDVVERGGVGRTRREGTRDEAGCFVRVKGGGGSVIRQVRLVRQAG